jgi:hypothetical protein
MSYTFTDRLSLARERLNIALDPAARAARSGREPGASLDAAAADPYAGEAPGFVPAGMMANPAATNFGRLAEARTDVPRFVMAGEAPAGLTPGQAQARTGIDVTGYVGSRYAGNNNPQGITPGLAAAAPAPAPATTMLPTGNLAARDALLRAAFPNADRRGVQGLGALAFNRPETFNTAVAGTALDATAAEARRKQGEASLAATQMGTAASRQGMTFQQELQPGALAAQSLAAQATGQGIQTSIDEATRRATGDAATQNFFSADDNAAIGAAAAGGAPAAVLFDMAALARTRAQDAQSAARATPTETTLLGRRAVVANGNVQFEQGSKPPATTLLYKLRAERAQALADGDTTGVKDYDQAIQNEITRPKTFFQEAMNRQGAPAAGAATPAAAAPAAPRATAPRATAPVATAPAGSSPAAAKANPNSPEAGRIWLAANPDHPLAAAVRARLGL